MMYIRTKDGRIIDPSKIATGSKYMDFDTNDESFRKIFKTEPLSKSENLEELCDVFVLIERNAKPIIFKTLQGTINNKIYDDEIIYGCIWTDKGLIYVAKMNENGELEVI